MRPEVKWFINRHEHRNHWLRFGLMRLHRQGEIKYLEAPLAACVDAGFAPEVAVHEHRHTSVIAVKDRGATIRCIVDSEDSFFWLSPLVAYADVYFCAGYNKAFFRDRIFQPPFDWFQPHETSFYISKAQELIQTYGHLFERVQPFVPICPNTAPKGQSGWIDQKIRNLQFKITSRVSSSIPWMSAWVDFERRYSELIKLRDVPLAYDIVLNDTLWGWPRHRLALHVQLQNLAQTRKVHSRLSWSDPVSMDGGDRFLVPKSSFPMQCGAIGDYEAMLSGSRLAVFATGFHWGWRNIMTFALMMGTPILADKLLLEPWFDINRFRISWNTTENWDELESTLGAISDSDWQETRSHNQALFDELLGPEKVAGYFLQRSLLSA